MLNLYYGRESLDKEAFLFSEIKKDLEKMRAEKTKAERILLVVPAQFTLKAEEAAFFHLKEKGFFDLHIMSGNRLRSRILGEVGQTGKIAVNSLGRNMLLRKIAREKKDKLHAFSKVVETDEFLSMAGDFIVQLKQNNLSAEGLKEIIERTNDRELLKKKLTDMHEIYTAYQETLQGKFNDSEDTLKAICERVGKSNYIKTSEIWYYDFYSFVPSEIDFMRELIKYAVDLNVVLTSGDVGDNDRLLFEPAMRSIKDLQKTAEDLSLPCCVFPIDQEFTRKEKPKALAHIEKQLYAMPCEVFSEKEEALPVHLLRASNPYTESETIASQIKALVRDKHYAYDDIAVLTNDIEMRGAMLRRVFALHEIPCFIDEKRTLLHNPLIKTITSLLNIVSDNFRAEDVLQFLKSGLVKFADVEAFENYINQYHINHSRFLSPFKYGIQKLGTEKMDELEAFRFRLEKTILPFKETLGKATSLKEKSTVLYNFLSQTLLIPQTLSTQALHLAEQGMIDAAEEAQQVWKVLLELMDQMVELLGEEDISISDYRDILESSFSDIKVGLLPQADHKVLIGTVGRSRIPEIKVLFIAGVNDGILPTDIGGEGILTDVELSLLEEQGHVLSKSDARMQEEERLVIYKAFSKPTEELYVSYSVADAEGKEIRASVLVAQLLSMFPELCEESDIENAVSEIGFIQSRQTAAAHLSSALRKVLSGEEAMLSPLLKQSYNTLLNMNEERLQIIKKGLFFRNQIPPLSSQITADLYKSYDEEREFSFSPSRLERFAGCPFMHYVSYGLRPDEQKSFEISGSEIGDIHHECIMRLSRELSEESQAAGLAVTDPKSIWMTLTKEACHKRMEAIIATIIEESFEGLLQAGKEEAYRTKRVTAVSTKFAWKMIEHVRQGNIEHILSEAEFSRESSFSLPALEIDTGKNKVLLEGKIDRVDILNFNEGEASIKIIDYKSGSIKFNKEKIEKGLSLQLMIYLEGALGYRKNAKPAGIFYYHIEDPRLAASLNEITSDAISEDMLKNIEKKYRMDGLFIGEENKDHTPASAKTMTSEEFDAFRSAFKETLGELCGKLLDGSIAAEPRRTDKTVTACTYCAYSSICLFDTSLPDCNYR